MPLLRTELLEIARKHGLNQLDFALKDYVQDFILFIISQEYPLESYIFKGGTALYKIYGSPRFSEDLDFTTYNSFDINTIVENLSNYGFDAKLIKSRSIVGKTVQSVNIQVGYKGLGSTNLMVEVNLVGEKLEGSVIEYVSKYPDIPPFLLNVATKNQMFRDKIRMLTEREKVRDLFDAYFLAFRHNMKIKLSKLEKERVLSHVVKFRNKWRYLSRLLIGTRLPVFNNVLDALEEAIEVD
ncbi:MAG: nucleotidyl transferase AbiEii/AbiGii toxin family protein [Candidatus Njordarchaeia archaeon]